ncbi:UNVERIFIED_CONTAM: Mini-ribonuclease 3 [Sesamum angustifolium]|uniref:Mini-ribonuclease 3 n=1 Tax=Sesamum angustifolium TaxID=2727405 RepID=A0AAW2LK41_9LAMI
MKILGRRFSSTPKAETPFIRKTLLLETPPIGKSTHCLQSANRKISGETQYGSGASSTIALLHHKSFLRGHRTPPFVQSPPHVSKKPDALAAASVSTLTTTLDKSTAKISISDLLKRDISKNRHVEFVDSYLGYETWLPSPPKVEKPRSILNPASLAYIGDCIYELYARRHFLFPPLNIEEYNDRVMAVVRCEAQDAMLQKLMNDNILSQEERDVLRWGKNIGSSKTKTKKRAGSAVYNRASSLETLVGYLYLTNAQRLDEIMEKIGFSTDTSNPLGEET